MRARAALELGRVSNLPTVWSNCLAGALLGGALLGGELMNLAPLGWTVLATSLMYLGGMFLNDAFDADWDRRHNTGRPIPRGDADVGEVWFWGLLLLAAGPLLLALLPAPQGGRAPALYAALALAAAILAYDALHKRLSLSPWIMGCCRLLVYLTAGLAAGAMTPLLLLGGLALMGYIVGITYVARTEHLNHPGAWWPLLLFAAPALLALWQLRGQPASALTLALLLGWIGLQLRQLLPGPRRNVRAGVGGLLAGIPLVDASALAGIGQWLAAAAALAAFAATLLSQRLIAGT